MRFDAAKPRGGSISPLEIHADFLLALMARQPDLTLDEVAFTMRKHGIAGSRSAAYAIALQSAEPFGIRRLWENWKDLRSGEWIRTFAAITTDANRMPLIIAPGDYTPWLGDEPDPRDLLRPISGRADTHVADFDAGEQAGERRSINSGADWLRRSTCCSRSPSSNGRSPRSAFETSLPLQNAKGSGSPA